MIIVALLTLGYQLLTPGALSLEAKLANLLDFLSTELELLLLLNLGKRISTFGNTPLENSTPSLVSSEVFFFPS
jgi:hypothetical protein